MWEEQSTVIGQFLTFILIYYAWSIVGSNNSWLRNRCRNRPIIVNYFSHIQLWLINFYTYSLNPALLLLPIIDCALLILSLWPHTKFRNSMDALVYLVTAVDVVRLFYLRRQLCKDVYHLRSYLGGPAQNALFAVLRKWMTNYAAVAFATGWIFCCS